MGESFYYRRKALSTGHRDEAVENSIRESFYDSRKALNNLDVSIRIEIPGSVGIRGRFSSRNGEPPQHPHSDVRDD